jgi:5'-nucleotidase
MVAMRRWVVASFLLISGLALADKPITVTLLHSNDLHAHIEPTKLKGLTYGGYARQATIIKRARATEPNVLLLSGGDTFQGTLFFNTYEGLADLAFMNAVHYDAMAVGNHEFDRGPKPLGIFASLAAFPVLSANLDVSQDPGLSKVIRESAVVTVGGEKFGIVGATTPTVTNISSPGPTVKLKDLHDSVQGAVDKLLGQGIDRIFLVTHIGYGEDQALVKTLHGVSFVVGAHSHTPLGTPDLPGWPKSQGPYPTIVKDSAGVSVPIVQCWEWGKVFGHITLDFDAKGRLVRWRNAKPIIVDATIPEDTEVAAMIAAFKRPIAAMESQPIGQTPAAISKEARDSGDSAMADVIADGMQAATAKSGSVTAFVNSGGVRGGLEPGKITYGELISIEPFGNTLVVLDLSGAELKAALEEGVGTGGELLPSKGSGYRIDSSKPLGARVSDVVVNGIPLDLAQTYRVTFLNFTANGGDAHQVLKDAKGTRIDTGLVDIDALIDYVKAHNPLVVDGPKRIQFR